MPLSEAWEIDRRDENCKFDTYHVIVFVSLLLVQCQNKIVAKLDEQLPVVYPWEAQ